MRGGKKKQKQSRCSCFDISSSGSSHDISDIFFSIISVGNNDIPA